MSRRASAEGTSYRQVADWRNAAICRDDPEGWDLDVIGADTPEARRAVRACRKDCPVLAQCAAFTERLEATPSTRPKGLIQAGRIYGGGANGKVRKSRTGICRNGHNRAEVGTHPSGECKKCAAIRQKKRQEVT